MPRLPIPKNRTKINVTPPGTIQSPERLSQQTYQGMSELGNTLSQVGQQFTQQILQERETAEISSAQGDIEQMLLEYELREKAGVTEQGESLAPENAPERFNQFRQQAEERIASAQGRGARKYLTNWWSRRATDYQRSFLSTVKNQSRERNAVKYSQWLAQQKKQPVRISAEGRPTDENYVKAVKKAIDERESFLEQGIINWSQNNPKVASKAASDIEDIQNFIPVEVTKEVVFPLGREEGKKWLRKNWKSLGLSISQYNKVSDDLEDLWDNEELIYKKQTEQQINEEKTNIWSAIREGNFAKAQQIVDSSTLPVDGQGGKKWWTDYIRSRKEAELKGTKTENNQEAIREINHMADDLWSGRVTWEEFRESLAQKEKDGLISPEKVTDLIDDAQTDLEPLQRRELTAILNEAEDQLVSIPDPKEDPQSFSQFMMTGEQSKDEIEKERSKQILKYNNFRADYIKWKNDNPTASQLEMQEKRLELLYGKYLSSEDIKIRERVEMSLSFDIGDERVAEDGTIEVYIGAGNWQEIIPEEK